MEYKYDPDADVLAVFLRKEPFSHAQEMGDIVVHFDKNDKPVYLEILNANRFLSRATQVLPTAIQKAILRRTHAA